MALCVHISSWILCIQLILCFHYVRDLLHCVKDLLRILSHSTNGRRPWLLQVFTHHYFSMNWFLCWRMRDILGYCMELKESLTEVFLKCFRVILLANPGSNAVGPFMPVPAFSRFLFLCNKCLASCQVAWMYLYAQGPLSNGRNPSDLRSTGRYTVLSSHSAGS